MCGSLKDTRFLEQPLNPCLEYWLGHKAIHTALQSLNLELVKLV